MTDENVMKHVSQGIEYEMTAFVQACGRAGLDAWTRRHTVADAVEAARYQELDDYTMAREARRQLENTLFAPGAGLGLTATRAVAGDLIRAARADLRRGGS